MRKIKLNAAQAEAVEAIDGPLLVLAGPGTGKTQLLSARVARILEKTDTLAENILCLTFTEKGAANMLERLASFIGKEAYKVNISTYHAFGGDLIGRYPEFFGYDHLESAIDELGQHEILAAIIDELSYQNPLKSSRYHLNDLISTISEIKRALLAPAAVRQIAKDNLDFLSKINPKVIEVFDNFSRMPTKFAAARPNFDELLDLLSGPAAKPESLAASLANSLSLALESAEESGSTKPLTAWKNNFLAKNSANQFIIAGELESKRLAALAEVLEAYQNQLSEKGLYDYDDMIIKSISALEKNDDFKFTLQEKYQYILLDEYQDTNAAQAKLVELLTDNPVNEGRSNVMAVGDDDQAIYAFQGAEASNLSSFADRYTGTKIVSLSENYRSGADVITTADNIARQISDRASTNFKTVTKSQTAASEKSAQVERRDFLSNAAELDWVASEIEKLIAKRGVKPSQIAVLAPRHKVLEPLVPFLNNLDIPVRYEKRENILDAPVVNQLVTMARLVDGLAHHNEPLAASLWPEILSYDFWQIPLADIWEISWQKDRNWTRKIMASKLRWIGLFFTQLAGASRTETLETMLDYLIGSRQLKMNDENYPNATSPLKDFYTNSIVESADPVIFYQTISDLTVLRNNLRDRQASEDGTHKLADLIKLIDLYQASETKMVNTSPYNQAQESVQLMTVYKAKGLEFEHVFLLSCQDEVWGKKARGNSNKITLPANLASIRRAGSTDDERLRLLFVGTSRARRGLYLTSYRQTFSGKPTTRLEYLDEREQADHTFQTLTLPAGSQNVMTDDAEVPSLATLEINWQNRHVNALTDTDMRSLLAERLEKYQLSPTHLNTFIDLERGGPRAFLLNTLLKFPQAPTTATAFGNSIHESLEWFQLSLNDGKKPNLAKLMTKFEENLKAKNLAESEIDKLIERGRGALSAYLASATFRPGDLSESNFKPEAVFLSNAHLDGNIDKLELNQADKSLVIVDYKSGKPSDGWKSDLKLHKYKQQLYSYKILIENSPRWRGWTVEGERLDFVEPNTGGEIISLPLKFNESEFARVKQLLKIMWRLVKDLDLPDVSGYTKDLAGTRQFEDDLIAGKFSKNQGDENG